MPYINLIQEQRSGIRQQEKKARTLFFLFAGVTCVSVLGFGYLMLETEQSNGDYQTLQRQFQKLQPVVSQIESNDKQLQTLSPRLTTLQGAQLATDRWSRILDHLSRNVPTGVWLTNLRCVTTDPTNPIQMSVTGMSATQDAVGDLILRLQGCADLSNVTLKYTQEKTVDTKKGLEFEVTGDIVGTEEKKAKDESDGKKESS